MKKTFLMALMVMLSVAAYAQRSVTKFLGIPVDGTKSEMIRKLEAKGFRYDSSTDILEGEFNGRNVYVGVVTNKGKVWRIGLSDVTSSSETNIHIRFNKLVEQFNRNSKYFKFPVDDYMIPENEDISYEMTVNNKRYEAGYYQLAVPNDVLEGDNEEVDYGITGENSSEAVSKRSVWFMINEDYGEYRILMYYDNEYNHANGEDL